MTCWNKFNRKSNYRKDQHNWNQKKTFVEKIYENISLKDRMSTEYQYEKDLILINNILKTNGYYFSKINLSRETNQELNSIILNIDINLGEKAKIKEIVFIGDKKIKDKKLLEIIASEDIGFGNLLLTTFI